MDKGHIEENKYRFTIRIGILAVFFSIIFSISVIILGIISWRFYNNSLILTHQVTKALSISVVREVMNRLSPASLTSQLTAKLVASKTIDKDSPEHLIKHTTQILKAVPEVQMAYFGDENGNFVISRRENNGTLSSEVIDLRGDPQRYYLHRDEAGHVVRREVKTKFDYDPRQRPWYISAKDSKSAVWSAPYVFYSGGENKTLGITRATPAYVDDKLIGVAGIDVTLSAITQFLEKFKVSRGGISYIADEEGRLIAFPGHQNGLKNIKDMDHWGKKAFSTYLAHPLKQHFSYNYNGENYQTSVFLVPGFQKHKWHTFIIIPYEDIIGPVLHANFLTLILCASLLLLGLALVSILSGHITRPINELTTDLEKVKNFQLETNEKITSRIKEVHHMASVIHSMKIGLKSFQQYIPEVLVRKLIQSGEAAKIGGGNREITMLFTDIENFTTVSENISDAEVMTQMCEYFDVMSDIVVRNGGTVDKYIGDSLMAFWGAPDDDIDQVSHACKSVLCVEAALKQLNEEWHKSGKQTFETRFGLNAGTAIVGNLGSKSRLNYTTIGDNVNLASRLEQINKNYGTYKLVSHSIYEKAKDEFLFRTLDRISVKGQVKAHHIYELVAVKTPENIKRYEGFCAAFENAFELYCQQKWDDAKQAYQAILIDYPGDKTALLFIDRCEYFKKNPVEKNWDGVWVYKTK